WEMPRPTLPETPIEAAALASGLDPALARGLSYQPSTNQTTVKQVSLAPLPQTQATSPVRQSNRPTAKVELVGGSDYDSGRFIGSEFRKGHGTPITLLDGSSYTVGQTSFDPQDYATARVRGVYPQPPRGQGIKVGQNLVAVAELLKTGQTMVSADDKIE